METALVITLIFLPLTLGVAAIGLNGIRAIQVNQINRDVGHMFARGVDLSGSSTGLVNRGSVYIMAPDLASTTGKAVLILSHIVYVAPATCTSCPYVCATCNNQGFVVFERQIVLGNPSKRASAFGTVSAGSKDATSGVVTNLYTDTSLKTSGVPASLNLGVADGQPKDAFVSETYYDSSDLPHTGFTNALGVYARAFF